MSPFLKELLAPSWVECYGAQAVGAELCVGGGAMIWRGARKFERCQRQSSSLERLASVHLNTAMKTGESLVQQDSKVQNFQEAGRGIFKRSQLSHDRRFFPRHVNNLPHGLG